MIFAANAGMTTMMKTAFSSEIFSAATLHLGVLDEFIAVVQGRLARDTLVAGSPFARDSLADLLANLTEQRETYLAFAAPSVAAAA